MNCCLPIIFTQKLNNYKNLIYETWHKNKQIKIVLHELLFECKVLTFHQAFCRKIILILSGISEKSCGHSKREIPLNKKSPKFV